MSRSHPWTRIALDQRAEGAYSALTLLHLADLEDEHAALMAACAALRQEHDAHHATRAQLESDAEARGYAAGFARWAHEKPTRDHKNRLAQNAVLTQIEAIGRRALVQLMQEAITAFPERFHTLIADAIDAARATHDQITVRVHPDDAHADALAHHLEAHGWRVRLLRDAHVREGVIIDHAEGRFEATADAFLRAAEAHS